MKKILWGITYALALITFVTLLLWMFNDSVTAKWICICSLLAQLYGILTMEGNKKT